MKYAILISAISLLILGCNRPPSESATTTAPSDDTTRRYIHQQVRLLDSIRYEVQTFDGLDSLNENIFRTLQALAKDNRYQHVDLNKDLSFSYLLSDDKKLCLASWNTQMGGTMIDFTTVAIYQTETGAHIKYFNVETFYQVFFTKLYALTATDGTPTYFAYGHGQASNQLPYRVLQAFRITNNALDTVQTTTDGNHKLFYDRSQYTEGETELDIEFPADRRTIRIPQLKDGAPTGQWLTYTFNGKAYAK